MATITLQGKPIETLGNLPNIGSKAPNFTLTANDLSDKKLTDFKGQKLVLNIFPSVDTGTCAASVRNFNEKAARLKNTKVLCISRDLPFAQARFCGAEGIEDVVLLSDFRTGQFGKDYGLEIATNPMAGLHSRCVIILDGDGVVRYAEQVPEIVDEPNYQAALQAL